jgi:uncharacterized membrane protein YbhN (UPF0104 family)
VPVTEAVEEAPPVDAGLDRFRRRLAGQKIFGTVPQAAVRRHPSELFRIGAAMIATAVTALLSDRIRVVETTMYDLLANLPDDLRALFRGMYWLCTIGVTLALLVVGIAVRRARIVAALVVSFVLATGVALALRALVDSAEVRSAAGMTEVGAPTYPAVLLAAVTAVVMCVSGYFTRPTRRLVTVALVVAALATVADAAALPIDVLGALAIAWGVAALIRFALGSPAGTPTENDVASALDELGIPVTHVELNPEQAWGEVHLSAVSATGEVLSVVVIGRDASDAHLYSKLWRFLWYKDEGLIPSLTRIQQLEHRGFILLMARQAGVEVPVVRATGIAGAKSDALLVTADPAGTRFADLSADELTDEVLREAWRSAGRLHSSRLAHGALSAGHVLLGAGDEIAFVGLREASVSATPSRIDRDRAELLATTAGLVGNERALAAAVDVLGTDGLATVLPMLEPAALSSSTRESLRDEKQLLNELRSAGALLAGVEEPELAGLRRISVSSVIMAAATMLGVYLLFGQLAGVDFEAVVTNAQWDWVALAALLSQLPQFALAVAMLGSVATPLPLRITTIVQFANNFTGLVAGTVGNTTLVIRYFQRQGKSVAVAVSSGLLNSTAGFVTQAVLVIVALLITAGSYSADDTGGGGDGRALLLIVIVVGVVLAVTITIPRLRRWAWTRIEPQAHDAWENLRTIASMPRKAVQLFGGNVVGQLLFALTLDASLHAYGGSLPLMELVLINSFASFVGGAVPVPGGMGVVEAGLIGGLTAAGVPQNVAVAATFTHRLLTCYLPPIWGWFALRWLRRNSYV